MKHDFMLVYASIIVVLIANKQEEETLKQIINVCNNNKIKPLTNFIIYT